MSHRTAGRKLTNSNRFALQWDDLELDTSLSRGFCGIIEVHDVGPEHAKTGPLVVGVMRSLDMKEGADCPTAKRVLRH
jgi:hypothetical protein